MKTNNYTSMNMQRLIWLLLDGNFTSDDIKCLTDNLKDEPIFKDYTDKELLDAAHKYYHLMPSQQDKCPDCGCQLDENDDCSGWSERTEKLQENMASRWANNKVRT